MIVYKATSPSGKSYIGITTKTLEQRIKGHYNQAKRSKYLFHKALLKYKDKMKWEIIDSANTQKELLQLEKDYIQQYNTFSKNGYNLTSGGEGTSGHTLSRAKRRMISNKTKKAMKNLPEETKRRMANASKGKPAINRRAVIDHNGKIYPSVTEAAKVINATRPRICRAIRTGGRCNEYRFNYVCQGITPKKPRAGFGVKRKVFCHQNNKTYESLVAAAKDLNLKTNSIASAVHRNILIFGFKFTYIDKEVDCV